MAPSLPSPVNLFLGRWATTMGVTPQSVGAYGFGASQGMVGSFHHPGVSMSPVPQYDPSALVGGQYHAAAALQIKTPTQAACDARRLLDPRHSADSLAG